MARQREMKSILGSWTGGLDYKTYTRLFILSSFDIIIIIPFNVWYFTTWFPIVPWPGWKVIHSDWHRIRQITAADLKINPQIFYKYEIPRWMGVVYGFVFFLFFGVGAEARKHYVSSWKYVSKTVSWQT
jgi:pheromone a factor receptor